VISVNEKLVEFLSICLLTYYYSISFCYTDIAVWGHPPDTCFMLSACFHLESLHLTGVVDIT